MHTSQSSTDTHTHVHLKYTHTHTQTHTHRYNLEGDLLFSVAKDSKPAVWYSSNGESLGTFNGPKGAVWCVDVNRILLHVVCVCV